MFDSIFFSIFVVLCLCLFNFVCASSCCAARQSSSEARMSEIKIPKMDERTEKDAQMGKHEFSEKSKRAKEKGISMETHSTLKRSKSSIRYLKSL